MQHAATHFRLAALLLATLGFTSACVSDSPSAVREIEPAAAEPATGRISEHSLVLMHGKRGEIASEHLSLDLISIKDGRCPVEVQCIWAGHAAVTLHVGKAGAAAQTVTIGTSAPPSMQYPGEATYDGYRIRLIQLEPRNSQDGPALSAYRVTVGVSRL